MSKKTKPKPAVRLTPAEKVYEAFGGQMMVAKETGISFQEVYRWNYPKERRGTAGRVPHQHQETILVAAKRLKLKLQPADLVMVPG